MEIGKRWHKLSQTQKDKYKKQVEEQQLEYKAELDAWVKVHTKCCFPFSPHFFNQQSLSGRSLEVQMSVIVFSLLLSFSVSLSSGASRLQRVLFDGECLSSVVSLLLLLLLIKIFHIVQLVASHFRNQSSRSPVQSTFQFGSDSKMVLSHMEHLIYLNQTLVRFWAGKSFRL